LGPLPATCPPLPSARAASRTRRSADAVDPLHRDTVSDEVGVCIRASPCCVASKSRSESPDILPGGSAGLHSGALTDSLNVSSAFTARCLRAETLAPQRSEERRVGKECRSRGWADVGKTKKERSVRRQVVFK